MTKFKLVLAYLGIRKEESDNFVLLFLFAFVMGIFSSLYYTPTTGYFIDKVGSKYLPHFYLISGAVGFGIVAVVSRLQSRMNIYRLYMGLILLFFGLVLAMRIGFVGASESRLVILGGMLYTFLGPFWILTHLIIGGVALSVFDIRQGKRLFGLVNMGLPMAMIFGYIATPILIPIVGETYHLLTISLVGLVLGFFLLIRLSKRARLSELSSPQVEKKDTKVLKFRDLIRIRYFALILAFAFVGHAVIYLADYGFMEGVNSQYKTAEDLASFFGFFFAAVSLLQVVLSILSSRLISQYGMKFGLLLMPSLLVVVMVVAAIGGFLPDNGGALVFIMFLFAKLFEQIFGPPIGGPSFRISYQPIQDRQKMSLQTLADGGMVQLATAFAGGLLILVNQFFIIDIEVFVQETQTLIQTESFQLHWFPWVFLPFIIAMLYLAFQLGNAYRVQLKENLEERRSEIGEISKLELFSSDFLTKSYRDSSIANFFTEMGIDSLMLKGSEKEVFDLENGLGNAVPSAETVLSLMESEDPLQRKKAILHFGRLKPENRGRAIYKMLFDPHPEVRLAALAAAAKWDSTKVRTRLVEMITTDYWCPELRDLLIQIGNGIFDELNGVFKKEFFHPLYLSRCIEVFAKMRNRQGNALLFDNMDHPDSESRLNILRGLSYSGFQVSPGKGREKVAQSVRNSALDYTYMFSCLSDFAEVSPDSELIKAIEYELTLANETMFLLLEMMYDSASIRLVRNTLADQEGGAEFAVEILDVILDEDTKEMIFPLVDDLTPAQKVNRMTAFFPKKSLSVHERLLDILNHDFKEISLWTKAVAIEYLSQNKPDEVPMEIISCFFHAHPILNEMAAKYLHEVGKYKDYIGYLDLSTRQHLNKIFAFSNPQDFMLYYRVLMIKNLSVFKNLYPDVLMNTAMACSMFHIGQGEVLQVAKMRRTGKFFQVLSGEVTLDFGNEKRIHFEKDDLIFPDTDESFHAGGDPVLRSTEDAYLLYGGREEVLRILVEDFEVARALH